MISRKLLILLTFELLIFFNTTNAQTVNWSRLDSTKHILSATLNADYSISPSLGYAYKLNSAMPIILSANISIPVGEKFLDDFKTEMGGQVNVFNKTNFIGSVSALGIYRRYQTSLVTLQNVGCDVKGTFGYYRSRWFTGVEVGFDKAIVTHFEHTQKYRDEIYADVVDGWYKPSTGGNFYFGIQAGYSMDRIDLTLNMGKVVTQNFKSGLLLPFYFNLGVNYKLK